MFFKQTDFCIAMSLIGTKLTDRWDWFVHKLANENSKNPLRTSVRLVGAVRQGVVKTLER
jgi:hypothetical protein